MTLVLGRGVKMNYLITTTNGELYHHGILGQKWAKPLIGLSAATIVGTLGYAIMFDAKHH